MNKDRNQGNTFSDGDSKKILNRKFNKTREKEKYIINNNIEFFSNPKGINFNKNITEDSYSNLYSLDNTFTVFNSINDILYLIYSNKIRSIISYNLIENKKIIEIKDAHEDSITNFRYYLDKINKIDFILSISYYNNNLKIWKINNWECIYDYKDINKDGYLYSASFLNDNNNNYIITSNCNNIDLSEPIKIFDFNGNKMKEINDSNYKSFFIDSYYDNKSNKNYIISANENSIKSYDYKENKLYHNYPNDIEDDIIHISLIIFDDNKIIKLIESNNNNQNDKSSIRIWNFHSGILLNEIKLDDSSFGICLWNNQYLFVGCENNTIKLIELKNGKIKMLNDKTDEDEKIITIKKIIHPLYGECLLSQGLRNNQIKLWINKD